VTPDDFHGFFAAAAGVAGALVGLLFVAVSVTMERMEEQGETQIHRVRAATALTVSLFALIPGVNLGYPAIVVGVLGAAFVIGALMSMLRLGLRRPGDLRGALFLLGLATVLVYQLRMGIRLASDHGHQGTYDTIAILVVSCFVIGITRSWELIGGPSIGVAHELVVFSRRHAGGGAGADGAGDPGDGSDAGDGSEPEPTTGEPPDREGSGAAGS